MSSVVQKKDLDDIGNDHHVASKSALRAPQQNHRYVCLQWRRQKKNGGGGKRRYLLTWF